MANAPYGEVPVHEHYSWCEVEKCFVERPRRRWPLRRTIRHRAVTHSAGVDVETFVVTHQDPGSPVEVDEHGVTVLHVEDTGGQPLAAITAEAWWGTVILAAGRAAQSVPRPADL